MGNLKKSILTVWNSGPVLYTHVAAKLERRTKKKRVIVTHAGKVRFVNNYYNNNYVKYVCKL